MKALIFDVDDTLYDLATPFYRAVKEIRPDIDEELLEPIFISSRKYSDIYLDQYFDGKISKSEMFKYRNHDAFKEHGIDVTDESLDELEKLYRKYQNDITISKTIKEMLANIDKKWILGIISNGQVKHQMNKIRVLGLEEFIPKENMFITEALGVSKPHKDAFLKALDQLELRPEECYYIGDSYENDILGSLNVGMKPIWINHRDYNGKTDDVIVVKNEEELKDLILSL